MSFNTTICLLLYDHIYIYITGNEEAVENYTNSEENMYMEFKDLKM